MFTFSVRGAREAAVVGRIDASIHAYLTTSPGASLPMTAGLRLQQRWWLGPVLVPTASLTRICGPEPAMAYRTTSEAWEQRVSAIAAASHTCAFVWCNSEAEILNARDQFAATR